MSIFGGVGVLPSTRGQPANAYSLQPGTCRLIPAGQWQVKLGGYTILQQYDASNGTWRGQGPTRDGNVRFLRSDGNNTRIANVSGCIVGAIMTNGGSGYSQANPPTATLSAGGGVLQVIMGSYVSQTVSVTNGGTNYVYPPLVAFDPPPSPGFTATGYATLTNGAVSSITIVDQGAGYTNVPNVYLINDPRDSTGNGAQAVATLTGLGQVTGLIVTDFGNPVTINGSTSLPTITFSSGSAAATAIGCFGFSGQRPDQATDGVAYGNPSIISGLVYSSSSDTASVTSGGTATALNPTCGGIGLVEQRKGTILNTATTLIETSDVVKDPGLYTGVPEMIIESTYELPGSGPTTLAVGNATNAFTMGGIVSETFILPC